jgi:hypothetical protein
MENEIDIRRKPIEIADTELVNLAMKGKKDFTVSLLSNDILKQKLGKSSRRYEDCLSPSFIEIANNTQTRAIISLLQENECLSEDKKLVIIPEE